MHVSNGDETCYSISHLFMSMLINPSDAAGVTVVLLYMKRTVKSIFGHDGWLCHVWKSRLKKLRPMSIKPMGDVFAWTLLQRGVVLKRERAANGGEDDTRGLIIPREWQCSRTGISLQRCQLRVSAQVVVNSGSALCGVRWTAWAIPRWDPERLRGHSVRNYMCHLDNNS